MKDPVKSRAGRILGKMTSFKAVDDSITSLPDSPDSKARLFGIYVNNEFEKVLVTDLGLINCIEDRKEWIPYVDIVSIDADKEDKLSVEGLNLKLKNGDTHYIPVRNGIGRFRDTWGFMRFLMRVQEDLKTLDE